jgi:hypothetical protein
MSTRVIRNYPAFSLAKTLSVAQKIQDERAGHPFKRLLLAESLDIKPGSTNYRDLLSASYKYGLTEGSEKSTEITLTPLGDQATSAKDKQRQRAALRKAALTPPVFQAFYAAYDNRKLPSPDMMRKLLASDFGVGVEFADECARILLDNGHFTAVVKEIGGSPHVMLDAELDKDDTSRLDKSQLDPDMADFVEPEVGVISIQGNGHVNSQNALRVGQSEVGIEEGRPRPIFVGHGKKHGPLEKLEKLLATFKIPYKVVLDEPNLARPIPKKVKDVMLECNSAILVFTRDEKFFDEENNETWRPSENVVHELGAASYAYEDRVVIFKEKGLNFPTNYASVGYIEFEEDSIEARAMELMRELIGLGLVKIMPV